MIGFAKSLLSIFSGKKQAKKKAKREPPEVRARREATIKWGRLNAQLLKEMSIGDDFGLASVYAEMAGELEERGEKFDHLTKLSFEHKIKGIRRALTDFKKSSFSKIKIVTARDNRTCAHCRELEGKEFDVDDAIRSPPIPVKECSTPCFGKTITWCRCNWVAVVEPRAIDRP